MAGARGPYRVGRERRAAIIAAAADRFAVDGYHETSMNQLARELGITQGGLLHHFPSKQHLLLAVAEHRLDVSVAWWDDITPASTAGEIIDRMIKVTALFLTEPGLIELAVAVATEAADTASPAHEVLFSRYDAVLTNLTSRFAACAARGELRPGVDPESLARRCVAISDGLQLQWTLADRTIDLLGLVSAALRDVAVATIRPEFQPPSAAAHRRP
ncbi:TetR/AcrR family transcriptional regulator [Actinotalea sp. M2MS4P-6]|uniref:TetR/AcrR family transcriptional regulator n=1 Tax=Actinotalea sp. M2MS4P-6 TaxID=2983762 RepID=UPI0021E48F8E|nr:TetR/AcrR family transcriptional regulator [Actinotalea sp. M2MS4P-6]MCV2395887.1 TetR/AcrR family transcriptional regulator [Actinotalea sp. M2MS4P-6]